MGDCGAWNGMGCVGFVGCVTQRFAPEIVPSAALWRYGAGGDEFALQGHGLIRGMRTVQPVEAGTARLLILGTIGAVLSHRFRRHLPAL
jgi:hypothetical protein